MTTPLDRDEVKRKVRFYLGNVPEATLPEEILDEMVANCIDKYGDDDTKYCEVVYCSVMSSLRYLIHQSWAQTGSENKDISKRVEKQGDREIQVYYDASSSSHVSESGWEKLYEEYKAHPEYICESLVDTLADASAGYVKIGGVRQSEYDAIARNRDSRTGWDRQMDDKFGYRRTTRQRYNRLNSRDD